LQDLKKRIRLEAGINKMKKRLNIRYPCIVCEKFTMAKATHEVRTVAAIIKIQSKALP